MIVLAWCRCTDGNKHGNGQCAQSVVTVEFKLLLTLQEEEKERVRLKQQLKAIKNYDEEAVESRRIAREKEQYAEKKEVRRS